MDVTSDLKWTQYGKEKASGRRDLNAPRWKHHKKLILWRSLQFGPPLLEPVSMLALAAKTGRS